MWLDVEVGGLGRFCRLVLNFGGNKKRFCPKIPESFKKVLEKGYSGTQISSKVQTMYNAPGCV